ncbi:DUF6809 family protein [uncultured Dysosmobacter sp.]|uniref:DUF6809 family protein n=1 Tax=uncultured Dysosmobacter sp. TaxID=2591384 RepID=UPI0026160CA3|nr:DUF6809 family protein [uncultured Dysosmobacter sp.]
MTELMKTLYNYTLDYRFSAYLNTEAYRYTGLLLPKYLERLRRELPDDLRQTLDKYCDTESERRNLELEAMFQSAFATAAELR